MPEGSCSFQVGSLRCAVLSDGYFSYPTEWFFPNAEPGLLLHSMPGRGLPSESVLSPYTCLLIESGRSVVLVDTGAGAASRTTGAIRARLDMLGIRPRDVDTVILTHAHPDHIGGAVTPHDRPLFPNARHVLAETEYEFWTAPRPDLSAMRVPADLRASIAQTARRCLHILRFQLETVAGECEIVPGVRLLPAPGHTPGHLALLISDGGQHLMNLADAAVHPLHLAQPGLENGFDLRPSAAIATRGELLERAAAENMHVLAFHFPFPSVGRIAPRDEGGWDWQPGW